MLYPKAPNPTSLLLLCSPGRQGIAAKASVVYALQVVGPIDRGRVNGKHARPTGDMHCASAIRQSF